VPYKRADIAIEAFNKIGKSLKIIGTGPERERLKALAGPNIEFLGFTSNETLREYYQKGKALIFPGVEDFGIVPVEAMACGMPVIAYREGGATETVVENKTGIFFESQTSKALIQAIEKFEGFSWDRSHIRQQAEKFNTHRFEKEIADFLKSCGVEGY
jgi:glycosyltransferase involved in cell wall biosynthesis